MAKQTVKTAIPNTDPASAPADENAVQDLKVLQEAFELYSRTAQSMEESYRRLEERIQTLDQELRGKNRELALTTDYLNSILDSMTDGVIAVDTDDVITTFNSAAASVLGYSAEDLLGRKFSEAFGKDFDCNPKRRATELKGRGGTVPVSERNAPIADRSSTHIGYVKVFQDLREIESLREQVRRKDRLAALGEMAATVAHEIRNPLGGIRGFANLLERDMDPDDPRTRLVKNILTGTHNLDAVVSELLEYTRPVELALREVSWSELVDSARDYVDFGETEVHFQNDVDPSAVSQADPDKMRQVIMNVLINAVQSLDGSGEISVRSSADSEALNIAIADSGCGIPSDGLERVFSPFFTTKEKGTGLGLAVAAKIVECHGGGLRVESEENRGSVFTIELPNGRDETNA